MEKFKGLNIFLLDAIGALVSILFLFLVYAFDKYFGMPADVIKIFIWIATFCFGYSAIVYYLKPSNWRLYLKIIAGVNMAYCLYTIYHVIQNKDTLTQLGYLYFIPEIVVIIILSIYELSQAKTIE